MSLLIYGAYGYTGKLITQEVHHRNLGKVILAGRNESKLSQLGEEYELETRVFDLEEPNEIERQLADISVVLHCAGPFSSTALPMMNACIATNTHYLDITGEITVFELGKSLDQAAKDAGIILMPGVGFDVVPTDCLSYLLKEEMPDADSLELAFYSPGGLGSQGTQKTSIEAMRSGFYIREAGKLKEVPLLYDTRNIIFKKEDEEIERLAMTIPWGDVSTAYHTTGIPDIKVYIPVHPSRIKWLRITRLIRPLLAWSPIQKFMKWRIERGPEGPSDEVVETGQTYLWGQVCKSNGKTDECIEKHMITPNGYALTADASLVIAKKILDESFDPGYHTPAGLFSADLLDDLKGIIFP